VLNPANPQYDSLLPSRETIALRLWCAMLSNPAMIQGGPHGNGEGQILSDGIDLARIAYCLAAQFVTSMEHKREVEQKAVQG